jgi:hypothetical protein
MQIFLSYSWAKDVINPNYSILLDPAAIKKTLQNVEPCDALLNNLDLRSYKFNYIDKRYYRQILRLSFIEHYCPFSIEIGSIDSISYDVFVKYGNGRTIKFHDIPYSASKKNLVAFYSINEEKCLLLIKEIFNVAPNLKPIPSHLSNSIDHILEYRNDSESEDAYYKYLFWNAPPEVDQLKLITNIYLLVFKLLHQRGITIAELADWEDQILIWNGKTPKKMPRDQ